MANEIKKPVDPVIVVPGITATYLLDEYPVSHERVWSVVLKDYDRVVLHPDNIRYEATEPSRVRPGQIFEIAYKELIEELRYNLRDVEDRVIPVYPFGYDWRQPLETSEAELDEFVNEVIERTKLIRHYHEVGYADNPKVNLIGHSMGGLIIAGYLANKGKEAPVNKVVTLATPFMGSFEAVMKIATGTANLGTTPPSSREREAARVTPALYHLLPRFKNGISIGNDIPNSLFNPGAWQPSIVQSIQEFVRLKGLPTNDSFIKATEVFKSLLDQSDTHGKKIEKFKLSDAALNEKKWLAVVGVDSVTRVKLNIIKNDINVVDFKIATGDRDNKWSSKKINERRFTGDGTVPFEGAVPPFLDESNLVCVTPDDYGYWEVQDRLLTKVAGFHGLLPNMNMLHRMIVRFLKDLGDPRKNTWGRPAPGVKDWDPPLELNKK